jgi:hypothetical protein
VKFPANWEIRGILRDLASLFLKPPIEIAEIPAIGFAGN